jgi:hypothetical protein
VKGETGLRAGFMNLRTTPHDVDFILDELCRTLASSAPQRLTG